MAKLIGLPAVAATGPGLRDWIDDYLAHLRVERALSSNTLDAYSRDLAALAKHVGADANVRAIGREHIVSLFAVDAARGLSGRSAARLLSGLRGFFRFLIREGAIDRNPCKLIDTPKTIKRLPRPVTTEQVHDMFDAAAENATGETHRAILLVLFACGLRASEVVRLDVDDIDLEQGRLAVRKAKRNSVRIVPIASVALEAVRVYLDEVRPARVASPGERALFVSHRTGRRYRRETLFYIVRALAKYAGIEGAIGPHALRHGCATELLRGGMNLRALQALLGHADLGSTSVYTTVDYTQLRKVHRRSHPRG